MYMAEATAPARGPGDYRCLPASGATCRSIVTDIPLGRFLA